ncbi:MAG: AMP-binding protein [Acidimicrobiia bacterium]|nr:AMP-binding protein [Acidimicrobiia bacterium]
MIEGRTLWELVERRAQESPDALFLTDEGKRTMTFAEYQQAAERAAAGLAAMGIGEDTAVTWQLPTWIESFVLVAGLSRLGAVQNPVMPIYRQREVGFVTKQTGARLLVVPTEFRGFDYKGMADEIAADQPDLQVLIADRQLPEGDPSTLPPAPQTSDPLPVRWRFYTSGTTADPKGAQHTDATIMASAIAMAERLQMSSDDVHGFVFPFTHIGGAGLLMAALMAGLTHVIVEAFDPSTVVDLFDREQATLAGAGTVFHQAYLAEARKRQPEKVLQKVRAWIGGGAPKPPQLHYDMKNEVGGVGIVSGYGLTEAPILTMASVDDNDDKLANTEGQASPGVELKVVTIEGKVAGAGEEGEIRAKGPQVCLGYLDSSLDAEAFDDDGYFRTGDLGFVDAEGYVVITGRLKDVIIRKGENISAKEVEDLLYTHEKVADVAVIGLPDPALGERCCAVVALRDAANPLEFDEMVEFLKGKGLMMQKIPEQLETVDVVPRNPSGKIVKHVLRDQYAKK